MDRALDRVLDGNWFEKIVIQDPSVLVFAWLLVQFCVLARFFDHGGYVDPHTAFEQWYGFWVFAPTYAFDIILLVYVGVEQAGVAKRIKSVHGHVRPSKVMYSSLPVLRSVEEISLDGGESGGARSGGDPEGILLAGEQMTPHDLALESSINLSLATKWYWTLPSTILASCKISFDRHAAYSWFLILLPLYIYFFMFLLVAIKRGNWFMRSQREIAEAEERDRTQRRADRDAATQELLERMREKDPSSVDL